MAKFKLEDGSEVEAFTADELQAKIAEETNGLKAKVEELLGEKKSVSAKARELEEAQQLAEQDRLREKQEFKTLYEQEQKAKQELSERYEGFQKRIQDKEIESSAMSIAATLTRDTKRAELLVEQIKRYSRYADDTVSFEMGGVQVEASKVAEHIQQAYPFLVDGSQASGGGAAGATNNGGAVNKKFDEMSGAELSALRADDPQAYERLKNNFYAN